MVRLRQRLHDLNNGLLAIPLAFVFGAILLAQLMVRIDDNLSSEFLPQVMETTVESGRAMLTAIAGGLISSITLLLSLMLVAVQLASSQFSPRTLRDWTGDRTQQVAIGLVLGTAVYCLLVLRETRSFAEGEVLTPHLSVLLAVMLGVLSLVAVVRSVDHLTTSLRVGSVARRLMEETVELVRRRAEKIDHTDLSPARHMMPAEDLSTVPLDALAITAPSAGWVQQIDEDALFDAIPEGCVATLQAGLGSYVMPGAPIAWVWPPPEGDETGDGMRAAIALGDERTMQQDVGYGILQLVDVAVRALSPGINDPNTANDVIVNLGVVLLAIWEEEPIPPTRTENGRTLVRHDVSHREFLDATFAPLRRYGAGDAGVVVTMVRTLQALQSEVLRRDLPGPIEPIEQTIETITTEFHDRNPSAADERFVATAVNER